TGRQDPGGAAELPGLGRSRTGWLCVGNGIGAPARPLIDSVGRGEGQAMSGKHTSLRRLILAALGAATLSSVGTSERAAAQFWGYQPQRQQQYFNPFRNFFGPNQNYPNFNDGG